MGLFILPKGQQMVQGFPVNRSYTKSQEDAKIESSNYFRGVYGSAPSSPVDGWTYINSGDNGYYIFYAGTWQLLSTLTPAAFYKLLLEDGFGLLNEAGGYMDIQ